MQLLLMWMPGPLELVAIALVGLLLFGRRLPEVGRSLGRSIVEFKKGIRDVEDNIDVAARSPGPSKPLPPPEQPEGLPSPTSQDVASEASEIHSPD